MFEHLDDHGSFSPSMSMLTTVVRAGRRRRNRSRLARAGTASVATLAIGAGAAVTVANRKIDSVDRVEVASLVESEGVAEPYTMLLTGVDGASSLDDGSVAQRSDTIALVRLFPAGQRVTFLQLPRDLLVEVPGHGPARINSALVAGGPDLLVQTIKENFGIEVNHYASIDFEGARKIGDAVGGLSFDFQYPTRDLRSGFNIAEPGCHTLDGQGLLAFVRSRHLETEKSPGKWEIDRGYDLSRMARQEQVVLAALATFSRLDASDPVGTAQFVDAVVENVELDSTFDRAAMLQLFRDVAGSEIRDVRFAYEERVTDSGAAVLVPVRDQFYDAALHLFSEGELPADFYPLGPDEMAGLFPPPALQPQPQHFSAC
ncbi:MAG: LCP family protein [Acidimicrobiales bacterium]|jgi:LCP family protein required for cell wall assembly